MATVIIRAGRHKVLVLSVGITFFVFSAVLATLLLAGVSANAASCNWVGPNSGAQQWTSTTGWSCAPAFPGQGAGDTAVIATSSGGPLLLQVNSAVPNPVTTTIGCSGGAAGCTVEILNGGALALTGASSAGVIGLNPNVFTIDGGGTLSNSGTLTVGAGSTLNLNGGTLDNAIASGITFASTTSGSCGTFNWSGGTVQNSGSIVVQHPAGSGTNGLINMTGTQGPMALTGQTITNMGSITFSSVSNALTISNGGNITIPAGGQMTLSNVAPINAGAGSSLISVTGSLTKSSGGTSFITVPVNNTGGAVQSFTGILELAGVGIHAGSFTAISTGAGIAFAGTHSFGAGTTFGFGMGTPYEFTGAGTLINVNTPLTIPGLNWTGGTIQGGNTLMLSGTNSFDSSSAPLAIGTGTTVMIPATAMTGSVALVASANGGLSGPGTLAVNTNGTVFVGGSANGVIGAVTDINGGTVNFGPSASLTLNGGGSLTGATLPATAGVVANSLTFGGGTFALHSGTLQGAGPITVNPGATLSVDSLAGPVAFSGSPTFINGGTVNVAPTTTSVDLGGFAITNQASGVIDLQTDASLAASGGATIANAGLFKKTAAAGTSAIGAVFTNSGGTVGALSGTMNFTNGYVQSAGTTALAGGTLSVFTGTGIVTLNGGTLTGAGTIQAGLANNSSASVLPGSPGVPGTISVTGNYTQTGSLNVKLAGTTAGLFDVLAIGGSASLGGGLGVTTVGAFAPPNGSVFNILTTASRAGTFASAIFPSAAYQASYTPTIAAVAVTSIDLSVTKSAAAPTVLNGQNAVYTINVKNNDPSLTATNVTLTDTFSGPASFSSYSATPGVTCGGTGPGPVGCTVTTLGPGLTATVTLTLTTTGVGTVSNSASVSGSQFDPNATNNSAGPVDVTVCTPSTPTITGPTSFCAGSSITLTSSALTGNLWSTGATTQSITVSAAGSYSVTVTEVNGCSASSAAHVVTSNPLPATPTITGPTSFCPGSTISLTSSSATGNLWSTGATTQLINVSAAGSYSVTVTDGNFCSASSAAHVVTASPAPATPLITGPTSFCAGSTITLTSSSATGNLWSTGATTQSITVSVVGSYSVTVTDAAGCSATSAATTVTVNPLSSATITAPASMSASATAAASVTAGPAGTTYSWTATGGTIVSGQGTNAISFTAGTGASVQLGVTVTTSGCTSTSSTTVTVTVAASADLSVAATASPNPVNAGQNTTITETIKNLGPSSATNVTFTDSFTSGTFVSVSSSQGSCSGTTTINCSIGTLASGATATVTIVLKAGTTNIQNNASVSALEPDPNSANNSATLTITAAPRADVSVTKAGPSTASPGGTITYTITVSNNGPSTATNITVTDPTPSGLTLTSVSGACLALPCSIASLAARNTVTLSLTYTVASGPNAPSQITNTAFATTNNDPNSSNNSSSVTTVISCSTQPPTPVSPLAGSIVSSPVTFSWTAVANATAYEVFVTQGGTTTSLGTTAATSLTAPVASGAFSWFVVATTSDCGPLTSSSVSLNACNRPDTPLASVVANAASGQTYSVQWGLINGAASYEVQEAGYADFTGATTQTLTGTSVSFTHSATDSAQPFFYRVRAIASCDPQQKSGYSAIVRVVIAPVVTQNRNPNANIPAGSTQVVVQEVFIPGLPDGNYLFVATVDKLWMTVDPATGTLTPAGVTLKILANPTTLPNGTFTATVILTLTPVSTTGSAARTSGGTTISVPVSVNLVTPVTPTTKTTTASNALIIPSVGHLDGINSQWQSDIRLANVGFAKQQYALTFTPSAAATGSNAATVKQTTITVDAGATTALDDVVRNWYGVGSLGETANGVLEIHPLTAGASGIAHGSANTTPGVSLTTVASSRTYNVSTAGTLGQYIPAIPFSSFVGRAAQGAIGTVLSLQQVAQSSSYRTNIGVVEGAGAPAAVTLSVYDDSGKKLTDYALNLNAYQQVQLNSFLGSQGITLNDGRVEVKVTSGDGKVTAYASVVDNRTNDPLLVSGVPVGQALANRYVLPGVAAINNGVANWQTDMRIFNSGAAPQTATLSLYPLNGGAPLTASTTINPSEVKLLDGVVQSLFNQSNLGGALHVTTSSDSSLVVTGRTYNQTTAGTYGQFIPAVTANDAVGANGRALNILQVEDSPRYRTNLGIAEITGNPATVQIMVFLPDSKVTPKIEIPLAAYEYRQFPIIQSLGLGNIYNARISVQVISGTGKITAYGSVIDQVTQDPTYVPAQ